MPITTSHILVEPLLKRPEKRCVVQTILRSVSFGNISQPCKANYKPLMPVPVRDFAFIGICTRYRNTAFLYYWRRVEEDTPTMNNDDRLNQEEEQEVICEGAD